MLIALGADRPRALAPAFRVTSDDARAFLGTFHPEPIMALPERASVALMLVLAACSEAAGPGPLVEPITELPRALTESEVALISAGNSFGFDLVGRAVASDARPNVILSPFSASMALGMTLNGAAGTTFDAMRDALAFDSLTQDEINASYRALIDLLTDLDPRVRFEIANGIWAREGVPFHQSFFDAVAAAFDARAEARDFDDPATLDAINRWVEDRTNGYIDGVVEQLDPSLVMLLVNAIYFEGEWSNQFDPRDTEPRPFTTERRGTVPVDMMFRRDVTVHRGWGAGFSAIDLPYGGGAYSMVVLLPTEGTTAREMLGALDADTWAALTASFVPSQLVMLGLPKFTLAFDTYLNDALKGMGMEIAFRPGADFTRLSPLGDEMCISFVRQKSYVEVDERGTRAAAVTAVGIGTVSALIDSFVVDRPFVFAIRERLSGTILFLGHVGDPAYEDSGEGELRADC